MVGGGGESMALPTHCIMSPQKCITCYVRVKDEPAGVTGNEADGITSLCESASAHAASAVGDTGDEGVLAHEPHLLPVLYTPLPPRNGDGGKAEHVVSGPSTNMCNPDVTAMSTKQVMGCIMPMSTALSTSR